MQLEVKSRKWLYHIALFRMKYLFSGRSRSGVGVGVEVDIFRHESESESLKIRRLRSPADIHLSRRYIQGVPEVLKHFCFGRVTIVVHRPRQVRHQTKANGRKFCIVICGRLCHSCNLHWEPRKMSTRNQAFRPLGLKHSRIDSSDFLSDFLEPAYAPNIKVRK